MSGRSSLQRALATSAVLAALLGASACGGDDAPDEAGAGGGGGGGTPAAEPLPRAEFVERATAICERNARQAQAIAQEELAKPELQGKSETEQRVRVFQAAKGSAVRALDEVAALGAPQELRPAVDRMVRDAKESVEVVEEVIADPRSSKTSERATRLTELAASSRRAAAEAGLAACLPEQTP